ncbi:cytochrome bc complex cytochrome b subunit [Acidianus sulfidivorans JP7]|uniref:Cytochrome B n=1 Tax=Acidianus sulfidivorans JP7 TaxID=619593 RepID=A0A2U9IJU1_9CREN|nr:proton pump complex cytochrome B SoxC [Acidianus sulfidivorans]AWR96311.1 cytochrome bc complex cytochrome b subunit [Acidianus sulfidivorans JP7]
MEEEKKREKEEKNEEKIEKPRDENQGFFNSILDRIGINEAPLFRTPDYMYNVSYWLGGLVAASFAYTVITGLILLLLYEPANAYAQTQAIINSIPYGAVILFSHLYGAYIMIVLVYIHMFRNFFKGAYKKPRELQWVTGVLLLALTLGASFFGYSLVGDVLGINAVDIGSSLLIGTGFPGATTVVGWLFGPGIDAVESSNPIVRSEFFDRILGWHIIMVALIGLLFVFHLMLSERYGMTPSKKEKPYVPAYYTKEEQQRFNPWWPRNFVYMLSLVLMTWGVILIVPDVLANLNGAVIFGTKIQLPLVINPFPAPQAFTTAAIHTQPYPPWFFLFLYKFVDFLLPNGIPLLPSMVVAVLIIGLVVLMLIPFFENSNVMFLSSRKFWTWVMCVLIYSLVALSIWGYLYPGVPAPFTEQVEVLGIPALIMAVIIYLYGRNSSNKKSTKSQLSNPQIPKVTPASILGTSVVSLLFAGTFGDFLLQPNLLDLLLLFPLGVLVYHYVSKLVKGFNSYNGGGYTKSEFPITKKMAFFAIPVILVITIILFALMLRLPSVGVQSTYAGIDLGVILFLWGYAINLYHYLVYVKD